MTSVPPPSPGRSQWHCGEQRQPDVWLGRPALRMTTMKSATRGLGLAVLIAISLLESPQLRQLSADKLTAVSVHSARSTGTTGLEHFILLSDRSPPCIAPSY